MKKVLIFLGLVFLYLFSPKITHAESQFLTNEEVIYSISEKGTTTVTHNIILENKLTDIYASSYSLKLSGVKPQNIKAWQNLNEIQTKILEDGTTTTINLEFPDAVVGQGNARHFSISYDDGTVSTKTGEVWEISIPKVLGLDFYDSFRLKLEVPSSFGNLAYIYPKPENSVNSPNKNVYLFSKEFVKESPINAAFGNFQVFLFDLTYHLENPSKINSSLDIAVPADSSFQKITFTNIRPKPEKIYIDEDGNWLATYKLKSAERVDVRVSGAVQLYASARNFPVESKAYLTQNMQETPVWQTNDPEIKNLALKLKSPRAIYDYITKNLVYDFSRVKPDIERLGAKKALKNPKNAICMEFTDLFIALARAANIPAREINGFAYSENLSLQPLSLVADVLHAWPEYWDDSTKVWVPIDPTWGATTGGEDFFSKLDLRHFAFVVHGKDAYKPYPPGSYKLGSNPQKDVYVSFGPLPRVPESQPKIVIEKIQGFNLTNVVYNIKIVNNGASAIYDRKITIYFDGANQATKNIAILPPFGEESFEAKLSSIITPWKLPGQISVITDNQNVKVFTDRQRAIITEISLLMLFILLIFLATFHEKLHINKKNHKQNP